MAPRKTPPAKTPAAEPADPPAPPGDKLRSYRDKRAANRTPEPFGGQSPRPGLFVVQKHRARRLHHDLRLEMDGVLRSWAVPAGPSLDPSVKRLAVQTEDHPIEYADFEGIIPEGNYGAGEMIVWDRGLWLPVEDSRPPRAGVVKLLFELRGYKLRGVWTLVRTKRDPREWLLMKKPDPWASSDPGHRFPEESVLSGLTLEDLAQGSRRAASIRAELERLGVPCRGVDGERLELMLAETAPQPFSDPRWLYELKYDGYRLLAIKDGARTRLRFRSGRDATRSFPEVARSVSAQPYESFLLDGEVVILDDGGRPVFGELQKRGQLGRTRDIERAAVRSPAVLYAFDLVAFEGFDLRPLELGERKRLLRELLPRAGPLRYADHVEGEGEALFEQVRARGLEGVMAKRADSRYQGGRGPSWLKLRSDRSGDFVVVGWSEPQGSRTGFRALHLAARQGTDLVYAGRVGSGFTEAELEAIRRRLEAGRRATPPCLGAVPAGREHRWVEPELVVEVRYAEWTVDGNLRFPVFVRLRDDKTVGELDQAAPLPVAGDARADEPDHLPARSHELGLSRLDKVFWPAEGYTKGDLIAYHEAVAPWLLPYLKDRPVVLVRYPDGIDGKSFFQKKPPDFVPDWVRTESIWSEDAQEEVSQFLVEDLDSLLYLVNLGTIPLHIWSSRLASLGRPDWCILDLDPKGAPFGQVVELAREIHQVCEEIGLPSFVKTSGSSGLHVLVPLASLVSYEQSRQLGELLARVVESRRPDIATVTRTVGARGGRVYLDYLQNGHGKLLVAPFSLRPLPGAPVATPLAWDEVEPGLDLRAHNIRTVPERLARLGQDPLAPVLDAVPDLAAALERLAERMGEGSAGG